MATYYINADTGNDSTGDGSTGNPWLTLAKFISSSGSTDTCVCQASTANYTWSTATINARIISGPSSSSPAVFDASASSVTWTLQNVVTLNNLQFQNANLTGSEDPVFNTFAVGTFTANSCRFKSLTLDTSHEYKGGLFAPDTTVAHNLTMTIVSCSFNDLVTSGASGGHLWGARLNVGASTHNITITQSIFDFRTATNAIDYLLRYDANIGVVTATMKNCIVRNNTGTAIAFSTGVDTNNMDYSCAVNLTAAPSGTGNITSDPLFVDAANGNFNLRPTSPCLDAGVLV